MDIKMPKLGLTMTEGAITSWLVQPGQAVVRGEALFELENDKATVEYEAPEDGVVVELLVGEGVRVACGTTVARLETVHPGAPARPPAAVQETLPTVAESAPPAAVAESRPAPEAGIEATPAAKRRARELGVALTAVTGRGVNGRIHLADVEAQAAAVPAPVIEASPVARRLAADLGVDLAAIAGSGRSGRITRDDVTAAVRQRSSTLPAAGADDGPFSGRIPLAGVRQVIADRLSQSAFTAPHVTLHTEVDATNLVLARRELNDTLAGQTTIAYNALLIAFVAQALRQFPQVNACLRDGDICHYAAVNVGLAVDTERGLLVPVVRQADRLGLLAIQQRVDELAQRALTGKSLPDDLSGGTFTITNLGAFGIDAFTPIINQPQAAILGVGRIVTKPVAYEGEMALRERLTLSLSFDHRLIDGALAAQFLQSIGQLVERPLRLLL